MTYTYYIYYIYIILYILYIIYTLTYHIIFPFLCSKGQQLTMTKTLYFYDLHDSMISNMLSWLGIYLDGWLVSPPHWPGSFYAKCISNFCKGISNFCKGISNFYKGISNFCKTYFKFLQNIFPIFAKVFPTFANFTSIFCKIYYQYDELEKSR